MRRWMGFFFTLRAMAYRDKLGSPDFGLQEGGVLWFGDLTAADPVFVLPLVCGASMYATVTLGEAIQPPLPKDATGFTAMMPCAARSNLPSSAVSHLSLQCRSRYAMRGMALVMVPATYWMESGIFVYWITSNSLAIAQTQAMETPLQPRTRIC